MPRYEVEAHCVKCNGDLYFYSTVKYNDMDKAERSFYGRRCEMCGGKTFILDMVDATND